MSEGWGVGFEGGPQRLTLFERGMEEPGGRGVEKGWHRMMGERA